MMQAVPAMVRVTAGVGAGRDWAGLLEGCLLVLAGGWVLVMAA